jgi:hypothetical protein
MNEEGSMIDVIGAIVLTVLAVAGTAALVLSSPLDRRQAARVLAVAAAWLVAVAMLAAAGVFVSVGPAAVPFAVVGPIVVIALAATRVASLRAIALGAPLAVLVALHVGRLLGAFFLVLHDQGRLPATFSHGAGWGDIAVALLAVPVAWMAARRAPFWRPVTVVWNIVGFVDLVTAVTLGVGSTATSPIQFIFEEAVPGTIATLPWVLIPTFLVPIYLLAHLAVFARLAVWERAPRPAAAAR